MTFILSVLFIGLTLIIYELAKGIYRRFPSPFLLPILTGTILMILILLLFQVDYDIYMIGGKWIHMLLGPAVVALAYPLYAHRKVLLSYSVPIVLGSIVGALIGIITGIALTRILQFEEVIVRSIAPKSVTTPVAMEVSNQVGGIDSLAVIFVIIAGISGVICSHFIFKKLGIHTAIGRGVGMGSAAHAIGTAKALENSFFEGSISTVAMIINAIAVSILLPIILMII